MKATLIMLDKPILVNEENITENTLMYDIDGDIGVAIGTDESQWTGNKKIIAGDEDTKPIIFNLSDEHAERIGYVDVEKLANEKYVNWYTDYQEGEKKNAFIKGTETYASLTPKKYTEEDIEEFRKWRIDNRWFNFENGKWNYTFEMGTSLSEEEYEQKYRKTTSELLIKWQSERQPQQFKVECTETEKGFEVTKIL